MTAKTLPLPQQVCFALYSANNAMMRLYRPLLQPFDLTWVEEPVAAEDLQGFGARWPADG